MFINQTIKKFFIKDGSYDLFWFIFGLVFLFVFAFLNMPQWIFCLGIGVLTSSIFRYITTDSIFYDEFNSLSRKNEMFDYIMSKDIFTILFVGLIVLIISLMVRFISNIFLLVQFTLEYKYIFAFVLYILGAENIILLFSHKKISSYNKGYKRKAEADLRIGLENLRAIIPSLIVNICLSVLLFNFKMSLSIIQGIILLFITISIFVICFDKANNYEIKDEKK